MGRSLKYDSSRCQTLALGAGASSQIPACRGGDRNRRSDARDNALLRASETGSGLCTSVSLEAAHLPPALLNGFSPKFHP